MSAVLPIIISTKLVGEFWIHQADFYLSQQQMIDAIRCISILSVWGKIFNRHSVASAVVQTLLSFIN